MSTTSIHTMREFLTQGSLGNSEFMDFLKQARDQVMWSIANGEALTYLEIRQRRVQMSDPVRLLEMIERLLDKYKIIAGRDAGRSQRNHVVLRKPTQTTAYKGN